MQPHPAPQALALIDHIQARYHEGHRLALAEIHTRAAALQAGGLATGVAQELRALGYALEQHMFKEEMRLFPMMEQGGNTLIAQLIEDLQREHVAHDAALQRLRARLQQLGDAQPPDPGLQPLQRAVDALAAELVLHMHAEDDELFPLFLPPSPRAPEAMNTPLPLTPADATRHDVLAELNALLEAERAGARVAMETAREIREPELAALVKDIHKDEVRWCGMLMGTIQSLGATPSSATGAFWGKAMAIADVPQRLAFLNRGQAWVVRKLQALIPRIDDAAARADLERMLEAHHQNIRRVEASSQVAPPPPNTAPGAAPLPTEPAALIEHILARYHEVHRQQLPELVRLAARVEAVHGEHPAVPRGLAALLQQVQAELLEHMQKEETILFPMLARGGHPMAVHPIGVMRAEHEAHAQRLAQVLALTHDATPPDGACATWRQLSTALRQFADDLQRHIGIENDQLFARFDTPGRG